MPAWLAHACVSCRIALVVGVLTAVVPAIVYYHTSGHGFNLGRIANGFGDSVSRLLSAKNNKAGAYAITSAGFAAFAVVFTFGGPTVRDFTRCCADASRSRSMWRTHVPVAVVLGTYLVSALQHMPKCACALVYVTLTLCLSVYHV